jgi:ankyrin repeat protein
MLSIYLTHELEKLVADGEVLLYYFCDNKDQKRNTAFAILRGLLYQLLKRQPQLFEYILDDFKGPKEEEFTLSSLDALWRIFTTMLKYNGLRSVICVLDGLDECEEGSLKLFLKKLRDFFSGTGIAPSVGNFKLLVLSRDRPTCIESQFCGFDRIRLDPDSDDEVNHDIARYISSKVGELAAERRLSAKDLEIVTQSLTNGANGTFLWVGFVADQLKGKTKTEVEEILKDLPPGLDSIYERMLRQIEPKRRESVVLILQWVVVSRRPLTLTELAVATNTCEDMIKDRLESCGQLLLPLKVDNKVNLIHQSAKDYLQRNEPYKTEAHLVVAKTCFEYIQKPFSNSSIKLRRNRRSNEESSSVSQEYPLLEYATFYWPEHSRYASDVIEDMFDLSSPFCQKKSKICKNWWRCYWSSNNIFEPPSFTLMHLAAYFGITTLARKLIMKNKLRYKLPFQNPGNIRDSNGQTPLSWAARNGHVAVVELLLEMAVDMYSKDSYGQTPLSWAAGNGHVAVVKLLLEKAVDVNSKDGYGQTLLLRAAEYGQEAVVKLLLEKAVDVDSKDGYGQTPLLRAAWNGHEAVVKLLLEKAVDVDSKNNSGQTPLSLAAGNGHEAVVKLLLEKAVDVGSKDNSGRTPLSWAVWGKHEAVVKLLLEKAVDSKDSRGRTPLSLAAEYGHEAVVKLLLEKAVDVDSKDIDCRTPLSWAAWNGHEAVVKLLLEKAVNVGSKDNSGRTPLSLAAVDGHEAVVKLLLEKAVDVDSKDNSGRTPLSLAAENGHETVVKLQESKT